MFAKLWKASISFVMYVCLSISMEKLGSQQQIFTKFGIWVFLRNLEEIQVLLKSDKNNRYFTWRRLYIWDNILLDSS